jgi:biotin carboxyl carrier protein
VLAGALCACSGSERDASDTAVSGTPSAVAAASATAASTASAVPPASTGPGKVSALMVTSAHDAQVVLGDDGMDHVEYELIVLNVFTEPVTLTRVQVLDPDGRQLLSIEGDTLNAATQTLLAKTPGATVPASASVGVDVDVIVPAGAAPATVTNHIKYALQPDSTSAALVTDPSIGGPEVAVDRSPAIEIAPPLKGDGWLATSACCTPNVHRSLRVAVDGQRIETPETFAVDWALIENNRVSEGDGSRNEDFYDFGKDVLAVADSTVVKVIDGQPNQSPTATFVPTDITQYGGNQVILEIAPNVYAWYAHLQPGTIPVKVGDQVKTGTLLGKIGNSGPSAGPHLHLGVLDRPDPTSARSLPFVIDKYTLVGYVDFARSTDDNLVTTGESTPIEAAYPLHGSIQNFP